MTVYSLGYSPCPNDTYIFGALANSLVKPVGFKFKVDLYDVETLNRMAAEAKYDISKLSFYAYLKEKSRYRLLNCGAALGYGCGPLVVAKKKLTRQQIIKGRIVLPGRLTTAHLLFRLWEPEASNRSFVAYDRIFDMLKKGEADCGVIIHESRFTYENSGFVALADLGEFWEKETNMPIPLGCIAAKRELGDTIIGEIEEAIKDSLQYARANFEAVLPYISKHAQEMSQEVLKQHIDMFVNKFSFDLGPTGREAIRVLEERAAKVGVLA